MDPEAKTAVFASRPPVIRATTSILMCKAKANGNYINSILALREAIHADFEEACSSITKVTWQKAAKRFLIRDGMLYTPELTSYLKASPVTAYCASLRIRDLTVKESALRGMRCTSLTRPSTGTAAEVVDPRAG